MAMQIISTVLTAEEEIEFTFPFSGVVVGFATLALFFFSRLNTLPPLALLLRSLLLLLHFLIVFLFLLLLLLPLLLTVLRRIVSLLLVTMACNGGGGDSFVYWLVCSDAAREKGDEQFMYANGWSIWGNDTSALTLSISIIVLFSNLNDCFYLQSVWLTFLLTLLMCFTFSSCCCCCQCFFKKEAKSELKSTLLLVVTFDWACCLGVCVCVCVWFWMFSPSKKHLICAPLNWLIEAASCCCCCTDSWLLCLCANIREKAFCTHILPCQLISGLNLALRERVSFVWCDVCARHQSTRSTGGGKLSRLEAEILSRHVC